MELAMKGDHRREMLEADDGDNPVTEAGARLRARFRFLIRDSSLNFFGDFSDKIPIFSRL